MKKISVECFLLGEVIFTQFKKFLAAGFFSSSEKYYLVPWFQHIIFFKNCSPPQNFLLTLFQIWKNVP